MLVAVLAVIAGLVSNRALRTRLTQTALANSTQTAAAVAAALTAAPTVTLADVHSDDDRNRHADHHPRRPAPPRRPLPYPHQHPLGGGSGLIAFVSDRDGNQEIYVMNADGSGLTSLTNNAADDYDPAWSPDGRQIAFYSDRDGNWEIYLMNADGSGLTG